MNFFNNFFASTPIPENHDLKILMLAGAMYVEENGILESIHENVDQNSTDEVINEVLEEGFCSLDMNASDADPEDVALLLQDAWGVNSKNDLLITLEELLSGIHQKILLDLIFLNEQKILTLDEYRRRSEFSKLFEDHDDSTFEFTVNEAKKLNQVSGPTGIIAWDWARYVHLLRLAFLADMIEEEEAWTHLKRLKQPMKKTFSNWEQFAQSFTHGRGFWLQSSDSFSDIMDSLLKDPWSPWTKLGWFPN